MSTPCCTKRFTDRLLAAIELVGNERCRNAIAGYKIRLAQRAYQDKLLAKAQAAHQHEPCASSHSHL